MFGINRGNMASAMKYMGMSELLSSYHGMTSSLSYLGLAGRQQYAMRRMGVAGISNIARNSLRYSRLNAINSGKMAFGWAFHGPTAQNAIRFGSAAGLITGAYVGGKYAARQARRHPYATAGIGLGAAGALYGLRRMGRI